MERLRNSIVAAFLIAFFISVGLTFIWENFLITPLAISASGIKYKIPLHASFKSVARDLSARHILTFPSLLVLRAHIRGVNHDLKAGEYLLPVGTTPDTFIDQVTTGKGMVYHFFTIIPGTTFTQLRQALDHNEDLIHTTQNLTNAAIMHQLGLASSYPEGMFFPDTYYIVEGASDLSVLKRAYAAMQKKLNLAWAGRLITIPFKTPYQALIAASIIEKEAKLKTELPLMAGVIVNRLRHNMRLQFDPTVIYGIGAHYTGRIYKSDLLDNNPYNTYRHTGLPPTPISMPSLAALEAVMHPDANDYLYFVIRPDHFTHQFSSTLADHIVAVVVARNSYTVFFNTELVKKYLLQIFPQYQFATNQLPTY